MIATIKISNSISISKEYSTILALHSYNSVGLTGQFKTNDQNQTRDIILSVVFFFHGKNWPLLSTMQLNRRHFSLLC